jgi:hypothetical protein
MNPQDIVYETVLNDSTCAGAPFTTENIVLNTRATSDDGDAGPITTNQILSISQKYLVTVQGTFSLWSSSTWVSPPNVICGIPEVAPQNPSPNVTNYWVGADAEIHFAQALPAGGSCSQLPNPRHASQFQIDLGGGFEHREPIGGAPADPSPAHLYKYLVQGQGSPARFRWVETTTSDNYGMLNITVEQVDPTDAPWDFDDPSPRKRPILVLPNAPDPFNPTTEIRYVLPASTGVQVGVFDIRGRMIRALFAGNQSDGYHTVSWDGRLDNGSRAPSGTYFVRVVTPQGTGTERLTLVK